jgi:ABC-type glycerol-3-phosphate transport system substrate-binding protein
LMVIKNPPHPNAAKVFANWLLGRDGQEIFSRSMGVGSRRLDVDTKWLKEFGVIASKDSLTVEQFYRLENQSEEKSISSGRWAPPRRAGYWAPNGRGRYNRAFFGIHTFLLRLPELTLLQLGQTILCLARVR